jgi:hypothetical protein
MHVHAGPASSTMGTKGCVARAIAQQPVFGTPRNQLSRLTCGSMSLSALADVRGEYGGLWWPTYAKGWRLAGSPCHQGRAGVAGLVPRSVGQPGVVPSDAAVGNAAVVAGEPGDGPLDHGPVRAVVILEGRGRGALTVFALQRVVFVENELSSPW